MKHQKVSIDSPYANMAQMCVKTKDWTLQRYVWEIWAMRVVLQLHLSKDGDSADTTVGVLAVQLGLLDDAARLFREAGNTINSISCTRALACGPRP